ncbi:MAG TPA: IS21 family transposase [Anaeromyxobacteraceae bacterium]|nr:IS21 family transposase [Anaeromyxobacteraceae bacterium]
MATERLSMRKTREILRQKWELGRTHREIAASVGQSLGAVAMTLGRALAAGLDWAQTQALTDVGLEELLYGPRAEATARPMPEFEYLHAERRKPGVTLELLHLEYLEKQPDGYRYTQFCEHYRAWLKKRGLTMRQEHRAGEKLFVDYSGKKPHIVDPQTGEVIEVELFVAVLGASNYTFAEATLTQRGPDFIASHLRTFSFLGGVTGALVPDQLKSGVVVPCRYEPGIQRTYEEMALHYGTAVLPARPAHARDKAKVEVGVLIAQRWILARLRNETFFSLATLNERIAELLEELNDRRMRVYGASRRELFERLDRPALKPLPTTPFQYCEWKKVRLNIDYHAEVDHHYYSAPHPLVHEELEARFTATTVELLHRGERVASHLRSYRRGGHTTVAEHMPKAHQKHLDWTPSRFIHWAATIGPNTQALVEAILAERRHPEQGYRSCLGILRLAKRFGHDRLEVASARAFAVRARSYRHVESILKNSLDRLPSPAEGSDEGATPTVHENIRGRGYFH